MPSLVHQDFKPANFLIDDDNCPLLADFGTVSLFDEWQTYFPPIIENESVFDCALHHVHEEVCCPRGSSPCSSGFNDDCGSKCGEGREPFQRR